MLPLIKYSQRADWLSSISDRGTMFGPEVESTVREIIDDVRRHGDSAVRKYTDKYDHVSVEAIRVPIERLAASYEALDTDFFKILEAAASNVRGFHERQRHDSWFTDDGDGVLLGQRIVPMDSVGLYVPGGKAAYPSSVLMSVIPAQVAGVRAIHMVSPPGPSGLPEESVMAAAHLLGVKNVYAVGGAQAIAALAYGTETIPRVDKIAGPGNAYVAAAKKLVFGAVAIDSIAGPSEIVVLADGTADPAYVAADMLSQAEHDERSSAILVTDNEALVGRVKREVDDMIAGLDRRAIIKQALTDYSACFLTSSLEESVELVNELAPEHLEIMTSDPWAVMTKIRHAGAIFLGPYSSEPVGDYFAGPSHVLPTGGTARFASALGVDDFIRKQSIISYTQARLSETGNQIIRFAEAEGLGAHAAAIRSRLERIDPQKKSGSH